MKLAILDDYQRVALKYADWNSLKGVEVVVFDEAFSSLEEATKLAPFDIVCLMRERTPNLKFVSLTRAHSPINP